MASDSEACCESDPNFAVICGFLEKFGVSCGLNNIDFLDLQDMLENNQEVPQELVNLHVKLLRKARKSVSSERWERAIIKFCHGFCSQDAWEIERFGYKKARLSSKLRILKELLEIQFDYNAKFKNEVNKLSAEELRTQPLGRDQLGHIYWFQSDNSCQIRVYKEDPDEETWALVAKNREGLVGLITQLNDGNTSVVNEDSNSLESEKPIVDTGQTDSNSNSSKADQLSGDANNEQTSNQNTEESVASVKTEATQELDVPQLTNPEVAVPPVTTEPINSEVISPPMKVEEHNINGSTDPVSEDVAKQDNTNGSTDIMSEEVAKQEICETIQKEVEIEQPETKINLKLRVKKSLIEGMSKVCNDVPFEEQSVKEVMDEEQKPTIHLRIRTIPEIVTSPEISKKPEVTGVKERYIRSDSTTSSVPHRKAVDSAGFDVHTNYLKRPPHDEEDIEEPSYLKRPRIDRPTLLGNKRKKSYSDEDEVFDEITEPLMLVKGEGSGQDNNTENFFIVGETIEESVMYFSGEGAGFDCETGNEQVHPQTPDQVDSASTSSTQAVNNEIESGKDKQSTNSHMKFKLGTIIDVRSNHSGSTVNNLIKNSRWDKGKANSEVASESQIQCNSNDMENLQKDDASDSGKSMFFFGPGCLQVKPVISPIKKSDESVNDDVVNIDNDKITLPSAIKEKPRSFTGNRRKSEKPVRKISGSDLECKDMLLNKESNCETSDMLKKEAINLSSNLKSKGVELRSDISHPLIIANHVPKSITSFDEKGDSSKSVDNNFVDVPMGKSDIINLKIEKTGLPHIKVVSTSMDKPKSKLENVLEKINQGKISKKTDGLDLSNKYKNNLMTNIDSKSVDNVTYLVQSSSIDEVGVATDIKKEKVSDSSQSSSKDVNSLITTDISTENSNLSKQTEETAHLPDSISTPIDEIPSQNSLPHVDSDSNINNLLKEDIPMLEDNSIVPPPKQNFTDNDDLSPPPLEREVIYQESNCINSPPDKNRDEKCKSNIKNKINPNDKNKKGAEKLKSKSESESKSEEVDIVTRRITRRTRSNADKMVDQEINETKKTIENENKPKQIKKKESHTPPEMDKELEALATNRELRERKVVQKSKEKLKPKVVKPKKDLKNNKNTKSLKKDDTNSDDVNLKTIEEQIVQNDTAPPKKPKLGGTTTETTSSELENEKNESEVVNDVEPVCVQKKVPLLTEDEKNGEEIEKQTESNTDQICIEVEDGESSDIMIVPDSDPLACSEEDSKNSEQVMTLATFKIDIDETNSIPPIRVTRKRAAQQSVDTLRDSTNSKNKVDTDVNDDSKKAKVKRKRSTDQNLRRSVEEKKSKEISSSEDDNTSSPVAVTEEGDANGTSNPIKERRQSNRSSSPVQSSGDSRTEMQREPKEKKPRQIRKTLLGLEISEETEKLLKQDAPMGVRQSRRIAQLKIKEEAERRKLEELTLNELKEEQRSRKGKKDIDKDYKSEKKRRSKNDPTEDETTTGDGEFDEKKKRKKKRKHRDPRKQFDVHNPWKSSSGSSSSVEEEEEDDIEEDYDHPMVLKSDHEFSPESDLEGVEVQPLKRARTARKESDTEEEVDHYACQKCGQSDHPEWILLCDSCDSGWHCSCLRPALLVIPEGDWFCPPCQHVTLVKKLEAQLLEYDKRLNKKVMETRRKERLAYVGISLDNVLPSKESDEHRSKARYVRAHVDGDSYESETDDSGSESESISSSESDSEPIYQLRKRRQAHSYRFNDYDDLINSAIQDELDAVKGAGNQGRGKDISTIVNAEKQEAEARLKSELESVEQPVNSNDLPTDLTMKSNPVENVEPVLEPLPPVVPPDYDKKLENEESDEEVIRPVRKIISKKKHRKLNSLDVSSGDDAESDEDFKGSSTSDSDEEDDYAGSESSDDLEVRRGKSHKSFGPIRRSTRARISRYDRDFINDDSDSDGAAPRRKKNRSIWEETESEESDRSWGRRKRRAAAAARSRKKASDKPKRPKKKKKKHGEESDPEVFKKRPNIKFGGLNDEEVGRRTRGKKINYLEALGTDSDDDVRRKPPKIEESDDEYAVHEDEELQQRLQNDNDSDESGVENVLRDLPLPLNPRPKPRGRGKAGLKIPRKPKDPSLELFPPLLPVLPSNPGMIHTEMPVLQHALESQPLMSQQMIPPPLIMDSLQDLDDEPNPIEQINKNVEQMNEQEMEKMMEEEEYANRQLQLVALQIEKEKRRKERERLEKLMQVQPKIPKKRGRKPKNQMLTAPTNLMPPYTESTLLMSNNAELSEPPGVSLPMFSELAPTLNADGSPKKRRGRGKGKKTLAAEAAAAAASNKIIDMEIGLEGPNSSSSNTVSPAPDSPMHGSKLGIAAPPQPFSQSQPTPSVITRMLQSQSGQTNFPPNVSKYFSGDSQHGQYHPGGAGPRGPYQQQPPGIPHFPVIRSGPPPLRLHSPGAPNLPPMYHAAHRSLDPSPSGGGPINVPNTNRDRQSPSVSSPSSPSTLSKGDPTPPPYSRPPVGHFPPVSSNNTPGAARPLPLIPPHIQQHRPTNMTQFHSSPLPPNYHYGSYPPPPPLTPDEGQSSPNYPAPPYSEPYPEGEPHIQTSETTAAPVPVTAGVAGKPFDEGDEGGEFVALVSYFSSQREDDLDT